jgi:hypothetical protein
MRISIKSIRPSTVFFWATIVGLGCVLLMEERKAARLQAALIDYKRQSHAGVLDQFRSRALLNWADGCPLADVIDRIQRTTAAAKGWPVFPLGVPITVDPIGLERAGRSLRSPVSSPPADVNLTLGEKLQAVLEPLGLACDVRDASLVITARDMVSPPVEPSYPKEE